uniref:Protein phosphatase methylesterase 1 n=2 Tax=Panagrolaimus davidi TaxID=227884 RepID=A0A914P6T7_9BILA
MAKIDLSPLPWNTQGFDERETVEIDNDKFNVYRYGNKGVLFFCIHGAGYTGLSFAQFAENIKGKIECQIVAPDLRGHGRTECEQPLDFSKDRIVKDLYAIYVKLYPDETSRPHAFVIGHSMGGAMAIRLCREKLISNVLSLIVIDVVEGTALSSLANMPQVLRRRPKNFKTLEEAIHWATTASDTLCRLPGARQSVPSQLRKNEQTGLYEWICDLAKTQPFWVSWFTGISHEFLECSQGKVLIIGHVDSMDSELIRAEMEGKYQNVIVPDAGHAIHENDVEAVTNVIQSIYQRFEVLIKKNLKIHL